MPRGYRCIGLAALVAATALHGQTNETSNAGGGDRHAEDANHTGRNRTAPKPDLAASLDNLARQIGKAGETQSDPYQYESNERSKRDIVAQENMAKWAKWMFWATVASAFIATLALIAVGIDIWLNRQRAKIDQRPWLTFSAKLAKPAGINDKGLRLTFDIAIKNVGSTPAINCHLKGKMFNVLRGGEGVETYIAKAQAFITEYAQSTKASKDVGFIVAPNEEITKSYKLGLSRDEFGALEGGDGLALYPIAVFSLCYRATSDPEMFGQTAKGILVHNKGWTKGQGIAIGTAIPIVYLTVAEAIDIGTAT